VVGVSKSLPEAQAELREAWLDFAFTVFAATPFPGWLVRRGFTLKPWYTEREQRS
jgi:hypothetical protein